MRNFEERIAEISRRSEKIFKERKRRRLHILMSCIPLVLCIALFFAFILPGMMPMGSADKSIAPESSNDPYYYESVPEGAAGMFAGSVNVSGNRISHFYTSVEDVQGIIGLLDEIVAAPEKKEGDDCRDFITDESNSIKLNENYKENGYRILVRHSDGTSAEYILLGTMLIDQTTQQEFHMDENTCFELKDALGIPLY